MEQYHEECRKIIRRLLYLRRLSARDNKGLVYLDERIIKVVIKCYSVHK